MRARTGLAPGAPGDPRCADRTQEWIGLDPRFVDLRLWIRVPDDAATDPEVNAPLRDGERPDRQREIEVAVPVDPSERAHRSTASDRFDLGDQVHGRDLRSTRDRPARERRAEKLGETDALTQRPLDRRDHVLDTRERPCCHQLGPTNAPRLADAR